MKTRMECKETKTDSEDSNVVGDLRGCLGSWRVMI